MTLKLITAPTSEPVTTDEAKLWLRLDSDAEIDIVDRLLKSARQMLDGADGYLGRCLTEQTWAMTLGRFPYCRSIRIPLPPLISITSVKYLDALGAEQTFDPASYRISSDDWSGDLILNSGASWPSSTLCGPGNDAVTVTFVAGYAAGVPEGLKTDILNLVGAWFDDRTKAGQLPDGWSSRYRIVPVA